MCFLSIRVVTTSDCTTSGEMSPRASPALRRNATSAVPAIRASSAAATGVPASPSTSSSHWTRSEVIGFRAEPVIVIVSSACFASWIVDAKMWPIHTAATASDSRPRKSSGMGADRTHAEIGVRWFRIGSGAVSAAL